MFHGDTVDKSGVVSGDGEDTPRAGFNETQDSNEGKPCCTW